MVEQATKSCGVVEWGVVPYAQACAWQAELAARRKAGEIPDLLILCQHPPVITLGRNARRENLLLPEEELARRGVEVHASNRGGDVTFHGPGQLVGYPIIDLSGWRKDVVAYVRALEEVLIRTASTVGVEAGRKSSQQGRRQLYQDAEKVALCHSELARLRRAGEESACDLRQVEKKTDPSGRLNPPTLGMTKQKGFSAPHYTGVWVGEEKLAAIGVHISRWVTSHGFALNVSTDVSYFDLIVPCGIADKGVTSFARLLKLALTAPSSAHGPVLPVPSVVEGSGVEGLPPVGASGVPRIRSGQGSRWAGQRGAELMEQVKAAVVESFGAVFGRAMQPIEPDTWEAWLGAQPAAAS